MAHSSVPGLFEPKSERIDDYKERFDFYCVAHGVAEEKQKALFLTSIGQQMYGKLKTWIRPSTFSDLTLAQIVSKLKERTTAEETMRSRNVINSLSASSNCDLERLLSSTCPDSSN